MCKEKENDFYEEPSPVVSEMNENGLHLEFRANGRGISDYWIEPDDILDLLQDFNKWQETYGYQSPQDRRKEKVKQVATRFLVMANILKMLDENNLDVETLQQILDNTRDHRRMTDDIDLISSINTKL